MDIGARIKKIRKNVNLTQKKFADELGISASYLSELEACKGAPSKSLAKFICLKYSVNLDWLELGRGDQFSAIVAEPKTAHAPPGPPQINPRILEEIIEVADRRLGHLPHTRRARWIAEQYIKHHVPPPDIRTDLVKSAQEAATAPQD